MMVSRALLLLVAFLFHDARGENLAIHIPIFRRGGRFVHHGDANVTLLAEVLASTERRYSRTFRGPASNHLNRIWRSDVHAENHMLDEAGLSGRWYARIPVGDPAQDLEMEVDMLSPDLYTIMTTNGQGSRYDTFLSSSHEPSEEFLYSSCKKTSDLFHFRHDPFAQTQCRLDLPVCQPPKTSRHTLSNSGSVLGLAAPQPASLSHLSSSLIEQLYWQKKIDHRIFSLTILTPEVGVLSIGGTLASEMEKLKVETAVNLKYLGNSVVSPLGVQEEIKTMLDFAIPAGSNHEDHCRWSDAGSHAATGWHMALLEGIWVSGAKVMKNQPVLLDINCPYILAPPQAAERMYESISGAVRLTELRVEHETSETDSAFYVVPCSNAIDISLEVAGWKFPVMRPAVLKQDVLFGPDGGPFSLGKVNTTNTDSRRIGTGYCVGAVVETRMGLRKEWEDAGMNNVWILGEPFFRGLGVTFDLGDDRGKGQRLGIRIY